MQDLDNYPQVNSVLRRLPVSLVKALNLQNARITRFAAGHPVVTGQEPSSKAYLISEGWAISKLSMHTGATQILNILGPGSFVGISRLDDLRMGDYTVMPLEDISAFVIDVEALQSICAKDETLSRWLSDMLSRRTQRAERHLMALGQLPARGRLAFMMLRILDVVQQAGQPAVNRPIHFPMTQDEIGNMLGLTHVSISKMMSGFRKDGLIDYSRNRIVVRDVKALSEICGMEMEGPR